MAITNTAAFAQTTQTNTAIVVGVDDLTSAPANTILLVTAGATDGGLLTGVSAIPRATVTASSLHLFISKDSGTTQVLLDSALMAAHTVAATTAVPVTTFTAYSEDEPLRLDAADRIYAGSGVALAGGIAFTAEWSDF